MFARNLWQRPVVRYLTYSAGAASVLGGIGLFSLLPSHPQPNRAIKTKYAADQEIPLSDVAARKQQIAKLRENGKVYDVLIIGGGATGAGVALDAITRGLSVGLVERDDFSSGTSSRSTKLIHGGVRYLEKAFKNLDKGQLDLVTEALAERRHLLAIAPHLSRPLPTIIPLYHSFPSILFWGPYYYIGAKAYDFFAGEKGILEPSYFISRREARDKFPSLKEKGLQGGVVYYDGQQNDTRVCLGIMLTAAAHGANVANHVEVTSLIKEGGRIVGANVRDLLTGDSWPILAKSVVNATGPFTDAIRKMANPELKPIIQPSSGVHVVLSGRYTPQGMGMIIPKTSDGRVLFLLPWEGSTLAGTTDSSSEITALPRPHEKEIKFIIEEMSRYLTKPIHREDVDAAWSGIRPLAVDPNAKDTASTSRDHVMEVTAPGLITITGGKWTTYRRMAEDTVNRLLEENATYAAAAGPGAAYAIDTAKLKPCHSLFLPIIGAAGYSMQSPATMERVGFAADIADHLAHNYGDKAPVVARIAADEHDTGRLNERLAEGYPFIEAEVLYACRHEMAENAVAVLAHRTRLAFLNSDAALQALPRVISLMAKELHWDVNRKILEYRRAVQFIQTMNRRGRTKQVFTHGDRVKLRQLEKRIRNFFDYTPIGDRQVQKIRDAFRRFDADSDEYLTKAEVTQLLQQEDIFGADVKAQMAQSGAKGLPKVVKVFMHHLDYHSFPDEQQESKDLIGWDEFLFSAAAALDSLKEKSA